MYIEYLEAQMEANTKLTTRAKQFIEINSFDFGYGMEAIRSSTRTRRISEFRAMLIYFLRKHYQLTYNEIGELLNRDHSSVVKSYQKTAQRLEL